MTKKERGRCVHCGRRLVVDKLNPHYSVFYPHRRSYYECLDSDNCIQYRMSNPKFQGVQLDPAGSDKP
jgi:hypothetical protein